MSKLDSRNDSIIDVLAAILLAKAAIATFSIAPFLLGSYIDYLELSPGQASRVLSVEIFSIAAANILAAVFWIHKVRLRGLAVVLLLVLMLLNIACTYTDGYWSLLGLRSLVGLVEGSLLAIGFSLLGSSLRPDRNFGLMFAISLGIGALNVRLLPLFLESAGASGLFVNLSLYCVAALVFSRRLPSGTIKSQMSKVQTAASSSITLPVLGLAALLLANYVYFIGQGGLWSFMERWGLQQNLTLEVVANTLSWSLVAGVVGGLAAAWLDKRWGRTLPLLSSILLAITAIFLLFKANTALLFVVAACLFTFVNNFGHPYILGLAASIDSSSRLTVLSGALHTAGQATGPLIIGLLVSGQNYENALWVALVFFALSSFLLVPVMRMADKCQYEAAT
ncbi:MAG: MFS transporter [Pseudomonadota bacterium]